MAANEKCRRTIIDNTVHERSIYNGIEEHHYSMRFNDLGIKYLTPPSSKARETYVT